MSICVSGLKTKGKTTTIAITPSAKHPLVKLGQSIPWQELAEIVMPDLCQSTAKGFSGVGRKLKLRTHLGVYLLQQMLNLTDRQTEWQLRDNAAYQIFCGYGVVDRWHYPDHTKIEQFRSRISPDSQQKIANQMAELGVRLGFGDPTKMDQDSTVQEAGITYPSDARLLVKIAAIGQKVYNHFIDMIPHGRDERFDLKKVKARAREYLFHKKADIAGKKKKFEDLFYTTFLQCCKAMELSLAKRHIEALPWNIRRAYEQLKRFGKKYFEDVQEFIRTGSMVKGKAMSFHLSDLSCFNKRKEGKDLQFGRQIQLGRIGGNFMIVAPSTTVRMEDKRSVKAMISEHQRLFGQVLSSFGTDKGYFSNANLNFLQDKAKVTETALQKPGMAVTSLTPEEQEHYEAMVNRRSGIEPLIGHIKKGGQLGRSRMKTDKSTLASGYASVAGFNLRQIIRHQLGKKIAAM